MNGPRRLGKMGMGLGMVLMTPDLHSNGLRRRGLVAGELDLAMAMPPWLLRSSIFLGFFVDVTYDV